MTLEEAQALTPEQRRIEVAKLLGWKKKREIEPGYWTWYSPNGDLAGQPCIPDYCSDLNAMHEAENTMNDLQKISYIYALDRAAKPNPSIHDWNVINATADQRATAFIAVMGEGE